MSTMALAPTLAPTGARQRRSAARPVARPTGRSAGRSGATAVRLTSRGRAVLLLVFVVLLSWALLVLGDHSAATDEPLPTSTVHVGPGDTLWDIAARQAAPGHVRDVVYQIEQLNALDSSSLRAGQSLVVPAG